MPLVSTDFRILCCLQTTFLFGTDKSYAIEHQFDNLNGVWVMWTPGANDIREKQLIFGDPCVDRSRSRVNRVSKHSMAFLALNWSLEYFRTIIEQQNDAILCQKWRFVPPIFSNNQRFSLIFFSDETQLCDIVRPPTRRIMCVLCTYCIILPFYIISAHFRPKCADILGYEHWTREFWSFLRPSDHDAHSNEVLVFFNAQVQPKHRQSTVRVD